MPRYEYRCRECATTFELHRPMAESEAAASCPAGHGNTVRLLSTVSVSGTAAATTAGGPGGTTAAPGGGGCCGGGCCGG